MINKLGKFGLFVKEYEKARRQYPPEIFIFLKTVSTVKEPLVLDLGCGTGIATRQLARLGTIVGCDPDPRMLAAAKKHGRVNQERYIRGVADRLPFKNATFDIVTACASFHWFDDKKSIAEIKRVLKPGGIMFIVNKNGLKSWGEGYRRTIIKTIGKKIAHFHKNAYNPKQRLEKNGFKNIRVRLWKKSEVYTLNNALEYVQSVSIWNSVPPSLRVRAIEGLKKYFQKMKKNKGKIERKITVQMTVGIK